MAEGAPRCDRAWCAGRSVVIAGAGTAGRSAAAHLIDLGARVTIADDRIADAVPAELVTYAERGARLVAITELLAETSWTAGTDLVVVSPGFSPTHDLPRVAARDGLPVWGEVELAWQLDIAGVYGPPRTWLVVTGTNGKTTTTSMLTAIVTEAGIAAESCGNIGLPILDAMSRPERVEVLCAELSSFQLHWAPSIAPTAGAVLNIADDHLDWHGSFAAYAADKQIALHGAIGIVGLDDEVAASLSVSGRRVGFTLGEPAPGELGIRDGHLVDRAFIASESVASEGPASEGAPANTSADGVVLANVVDIHPAGPSGMADALAAAGLARAIGIEPGSVHEALLSFRPAAHRGEVVAERAGIAFVDDSKATNPHAAQAAVRAHRRVVLIAGGLLKGASLESMLTAVRDRLAAVVVIGHDRRLVVEAIARHAPEVPTVTVFTGDDGRVTVQRELSLPVGIDLPDAPTASSADAAIAVMERAVEIAWRVADGFTGADRPDAILLAPAAASLDMFPGYGRRGDAFGDAARALVATNAADAPHADPA